jgi:hypothetical protein
MTTADQKQSDFVLCCHDELLTTQVLGWTGGNDKQHLYHINFKSEICRLRLLVICTSAVGGARLGCAGLLFVCDIAAAAHPNR